MEHFLLIFPYSSLSSQSSEAQHFPKYSCSCKNSIFQIWGNSFYVLLSTKMLPYLESLHFLMFLLPPPHPSQYMTFCLWENGRRPVKLPVFNPDFYPTNHNSPQSGVLSALLLCQALGRYVKWNCLDGTLKSPDFAPLAFKLFLKKINVGE